MCKKIVPICIIKILSIYVSIKMDKLAKYEKN